MKITYIKHSAFLVETKHVALLFDYAMGDIPKTDKPLFVFVSHFHQDHFNKAIFDLNAEAFFLSDTIKKKEIPNAIQDKVYRFHEKENFKNNYFSFQTLGSTDSGISFYLNIEGLTLYHAGDNNIWYWDEEDIHMIEDFKKSIQVIKKLDIAFFPVDPRLQDHATDGAVALSECTNVKVIFPMHAWENYLINQKCKEIFKEKRLTCIIKEIDKPLWSEEIYEI